MTDIIDISIIGAGIVGCCIARQLAKYDLKVCLIEKNDDVGTESTKANSGIVHGGYAEKPGSIKAKFSSPGNRMYKQLNDELNFGFSQIGSFVIGFNDQDAEKIKELFTYGQKNGVIGLQIVDGAFVRNIEPNLSKDITVALYCPTAGVTSPYEFAIALAENAIKNGVKLKLNSKVLDIKHNIEHNLDYFTIHTNKEKILTKIVINAAGLYSDEISKMVGCDEFIIKPRQGQYVLLDKNQGKLINSVIFQTPSEISKGILVTKTQHGNLLIGPDATPAPSKDHVDTTKQNLDEIINTAKRSLPKFDTKKIITSFAGNRAASNIDDFIIEESQQVKKFIQVASIESPGLTAAPAIAEYVVELVEQALQQKLIKKDNFDPYRKPYNIISNMNDSELHELIKQEPKYGRIICRCEKISEGEICDALSRNIPITTMDAIKRRTRAGMGKCQGSYCAPKIIEIIHRELGINLL